MSDRTSSPAAAKAFAFLANTQSSTATFAFSTDTAAAEPHAFERIRE